MLPSTARQPHLVNLYQRYLQNEHTAGFVQAVAARYSVGTLERLTQSGSRLSRRAATMALGFLGDMRSNSVLARALHDADRGVRILAEAGLRELWCRDGAVEHRQQLRVAMRLNVAEAFDETIDSATQLIEAAPWFAEAWNQRAIAYYHLQQFAESVNDCRQALDRNPFHFAAAVGLAHSHLELNQPYEALDAFRLAIELNPDLDGIRSQIRFLEESLEGRLE
ncbi:MAG: tetratricopeptide repeat protein [Pirellulales bacterium]